MPVIILSAFSVFGFDGALPAARTMAAIAGVLLVAVQHRYIQAEIERESLVAFQPGVDRMQTVPQLAGLNTGMDPSHGIGADRLPPGPAFPEPRSLHCLQCIEASQVRPKHRYAGLQYRSGWDARLQAPVGHPGQQAGKVKDLFGVAD